MLAEALEEVIMISICCTFPHPDTETLTPDEKQRFGKLVHDLRKAGKDLKTAQKMAYQLVLCEGVESTGSLLLE